MDNINPEHYRDPAYDHEVIEMMHKAFGTKKLRAYCLLSAFKYRMRAGKKSSDPTQDIEKAKWYEEKARELL